ncbi:MAG: saccharopine dehydrogenase NADP-binding domain-containing protein [Dehalococcoidia bacterium]|nr:saccharopine dehydrogenase NADP-binding domain-containing protein [Dehalococcoidia bacterium]
MKKVLIVGAGGQGGPCASILARDKDISKIVLADIDVNLANRVKNKINSDKIIVAKVNAAEIDDLKKLAKGVDVVINLTLCRFNANIMEAAVASGAYYVDTASGDPLWSQFLENKPLEFDDEFKKAGLTALVCCGGSAGITNVLTRHVCDKLDHVEAIHIRVGHKALKETGDAIKTWKPTWCPEIALEDYANESTAFVDGKYTTCPPFSGSEKYDFPDPVGPLVVYHHSHEEPVTMPHFIGKGLKHVDFKYPIDPVAAALVKMGFASHEPIDVKGTKVAPIDVLMKLIQPPVDTFLAENEANAGIFPDSVHPYLLEISGESNGKSLTYKLWWSSYLFDTAEEKLALYRKFGTSKIGVALPAIVGAKMCMEGDAEKGVISSECLDPMKFLGIMAAMGAPLNFHELCSDKSSTH